jgi:hypothetical protein
MKKTKTMEMEKGQKKGRCTKKIGTGKEAQRGTQEKRGEAKKGEGEGIILERNGFKKKRRIILGLCDTI